MLITRLAEGEAWPNDWELGVARGADLRAAISCLCDWGLWSPDLNATNVLLPREGGVLFLDWDRAHFEPEGVDLWPRYHARLARSLQKLGAPAGAFEAIGPARHP